MQDASIITQCPGCSTQFRVTPGQLKVANGQVRCGSCLFVFSALEHNQSTAKASPFTPQKQTRAPQENPKKNPKRRAVTKQKRTSPSPEKVAISQEKISSPPTQKVTSREPRDNLDSVIKTIPEEESNENPLHIQVEPVILNSPVTQRHFSWSWFTALTLALVVLLGQYLWFNRSELYSHPNLAVIYSHSCLYINCDLPQRSDVSRIKNQHLRIHKHPQIENAVIIDLALLNFADFHQPYPALALTFSDLKGRPVAQRVLQPADYLNSSLASENSMPINQLVQVTIEMMSPGPRGVNYSLELLASQQ